MADSKRDMEVCCNRWMDVYYENDFERGKAISIQNKGYGRVLVLITADEPDPDVMSGWIIDNYKSVDIYAGESGVWVKAIMCDAVINVQEA